MCITSLSWFISSYDRQQSSFSSDHQGAQLQIANPPQDMCITSLSWFISSYDRQQSSFSSDHQGAQLQIANPPQGSRSLRLEIVPVQQQDGVHDCGLFAIAYGTEECRGRRPDYNFVRKLNSVETV